MIIEEKVAKKEIKELLDQIKVVGDRDWETPFP